MINHSSHYRRTWLFLVCYLMIQTNISAGHTTSRYFPFIEKPETYTTRSRGYFSPMPFFTVATNAFNRDNGSAGIPELAGTYDLKDVINSLATVTTIQNGSFTNPLSVTTGIEGLVNSSLIYKVTGHVRSGGVIFDGAFGVIKDYLYIGATLPFMHTQTSHKFTLLTSIKDANGNDSTDQQVKLLLPGQINQVERVRAEVHEQIGLKPDNWDRTGFADLDVYLRLHRYWEHRFLMKSINLNLIGGIVIPTGVSMSKNYAFSIPFMGDNHWGLHIDEYAELELKTDVKVGLISSFMFQLPHTTNRRLPVFKEPAPFSALVGATKISPGMTFKISPYITFENFSDGLHLHGRYTYLRHGDDTWHDRRSNRTIPSYLSQTGTTQAETLQISINKDLKKRLSAWRAHYVTLCISYDSQAALKQWALNPTFFVQYDCPAAGHGISKTHQVTVGIEFHFS